MKQLDEKLDRLFKEQMCCEERSTFLNQSIMNLREENRRHKKQEIVVRDYSDRVLEIKSMVEN